MVSACHFQQRCRQWAVEGWSQCQNHPHASCAAAKGILSQKTTVGGWRVGVGKAAYAHAGTAGVMWIFSLQMAYLRQGFGRHDGVIIILVICCKKLCLDGQSFGCNP